MFVHFFHNGITMEFQSGIQVFIRNYVDRTKKGVHIAIGGCYPNNCRCTLFFRFCLSIIFEIFADIFSKFYEVGLWSGIRNYLSLLFSFFVNSERKVRLVHQKNIAEVFSYVNYVNVNYSVRNSIVDCKYLLYFLWVSRCFF